MARLVPKKKSKLKLRPKINAMIAGLAIRVPSLSTINIRADSPDPQAECAGAIEAVELAERESAQRQLNAAQSALQTYRQLAPPKLKLRKATVQFTRGSDEPTKRGVASQSKPAK